MSTGMARQKKIKKVQKTPQKPKNLKNKTQPTNKSIPQTTESFADLEAIIY